MLSAEKNERLTRVGPGTPMGELLRRYLWPVATHDMATRVPVKRRLLGEDLVLYRDGSGTVGLLAEQCPHRRAALWLGCSEDVGLHCGYRGWRFDSSGACPEQPGEPADSTFSGRIRAKFGSAVAFRQLWTRESSIRYSPIKDDVAHLFGDPEPAWT
jgi:5,5'-dehydrodivanillate O-demethylase